MKLLKDNVIFIVLLIAISCTVPVYISNYINQNEYDIYINTFNGDSKIIEDITITGAIMDSTYRADFSLSKDILKYNYAYKDKKDYKINYDPWLNTNASYDRYNIEVDVSKNLLLQATIKDSQKDKASKILDLVFIIKPK